MNIGLIFSSWPETSSQTASCLATVRKQVYQIVFFKMARKMHSRRNENRYEPKCLCGEKSTSNPNPSLHHQTEDSCFGQRQRPQPDKTCLKKRVCGELWQLGCQLFWQKGKTQLGLYYWVYRQRTRRLGGICLMRWSVISPLEFRVLSVSSIKFSSDCWA